MQRFDEFSDDHQVTKEIALPPVSEASKIQTDYTWNGNCPLTSTPFPLSLENSFLHTYPVL